MSASAWEQDIIDASGTLIKYWFEKTISQDEQTRRFSQRIDDPRKIWKLSPMDLESHRRWYLVSLFSDAMFARLQTLQSHHRPVVKADDKRRARLNCIAHFLGLIPYEEVLRAKADLPPRQKAKGYEEPDYPYHFVPEKY